jgi:hypothetical protein
MLNTPFNKFGTTVFSTYYSRITHTNIKELINMNKDKYPSREELDEAFHFLHDAINRITVEEEEEEMKMEINGNNQVEK